MRRLARVGALSLYTGSVCPSSGTTTICVPSSEKRSAATCVLGEGSHSVLRAAEEGAEEGVEVGEEEAGRGGVVSVGLECVYPRFC